MKRKMLPRRLILYYCFSLAFLAGCLFGWVAHRHHSQPQTASPYEKTFLFILILSSPTAASRRNTIRNTWLNLKADHRHTHRFFIGLHGISAKEKELLQKEYREFGDIVLMEELNESYENLTFKLLLSLIWSAGNVDFKYLIKCDDDSFARIDAIIEELWTRAYKDLYWGFFDGSARVHQTGKWAENEWFLCDRYLPYARGGGYVLSFNVVKLVTQNSKNLKLYNSEDVSLGVWLSPFNINRKHDPRFDTEYVSRGCFDVYLVSHKQNDELMNQKFNNLKKFGKMCKMEMRSRYSYNYNWNVLPSKCCVRNDTKIP